MTDARPSNPALGALLLAATTGLSAWSCSSAPQEEAPRSLSLEIESEVDAYELAGAIPLPLASPEDLPGLANLYHLSEAVVSGAEPDGQAAFEALQEMGVRTILSVDGKVPDAALAAAHGMRYVHVPIRYDGIEDEELIQIAKTFRELEPPFYVHCFHGKHRGPAAAAVGRIVLDGADRTRAVSEMRQWCGTSRKYRGLYATLAEHPLPDEATTEGYAWDFPAAREVDGLRGAMVTMTRHIDQLELAVLADFQFDPEHPDLAPLNDAKVLEELLEQCMDLEGSAPHSAGFQAGLAESRAAARHLVELLEERQGEGFRGEVLRQATEAFESLDRSCIECHKGYRNG